MTQLGFLRHALLSSSLLGDRRPPRMEDRSQTRYEIRLIDRNGREPEPAG